MKQLLIIDGHAMIHRAYHALPPLTTKAGIPTNAIYGFFGMLYRAIADLKPDYLIVCFDTPVPTFRKELLDTYQAKRPSPEESLVKQFDLIKELLTAANIAQVEAPGFEADDAIGTLAKQFANKDVEVFILTGDRDILQLVDNHIKVIMPKIGLSQTVTFDENAVIEKYFVKPEQIPDYKALMGDASDNYSAVKGIGPKTAVKLINQFPSIENMYEHIDELKDLKLRTKLIEHEEAVKLMKTIATIRVDVPLTLKFEDCAVVPYPQTLLDTFKKYEMNSMQKRYFPESMAEKEIVKAIEKPVEEPKKDPSQMDLF